MGSNDDLTRFHRQAAKVLAAVQLGALGYPYPFWPGPHQHTLTDAAQELGHQLADALFSAPWARIDCTTLRHRPVGQPKAVATLHGGRLLVTHTDRTSRLPHTGRRIDRYLVTDLRLLSWEGRRGVTAHCPQCGDPHQLKTAVIEGAGTHLLQSSPATKSPSPKVYPDIEDAAFAEILGDLPRGLADFDQLWIGMPPKRETIYRNIYAEHPEVLTYLELITTRRDLIIQDNPREPDGYRQASVPFPLRPERVPDTMRLREHQP